MREVKGRGRMGVEKTPPPGYRLVRSGVTETGDLIWCKHHRVWEDAYIFDSPVSNYEAVAREED